MFCRVARAPQGQFLQLEADAQPLADWLISTTLKAHLADLVPDAILGRLLFHALKICLCCHECRAQGAVVLCRGEPEAGQQGVGERANAGDTADQPLYSTPPGWYGPTHHHVD